MGRTPLIVMSLLLWQGFWTPCFVTELAVNWMGCKVPKIVLFAPQFVVRGVKAGVGQGLGGLSRRRQIVLLEMRPIYNRVQMWSWPRPRPSCKFLTSDWSTEIWGGSHNGAFLEAGLYQTSSQTQALSNSLRNGHSSVDHFIPNRPNNWNPNILFKNKKMAMALSGCANMSAKQLLHKVWPNAAHSDSRNEIC